MRFLCDVCERLAPPAAFRVELHTLVLTCARCGSETRGRADEVAAAAHAEAAQEESDAPLPPRASSSPALKVVTLRPSGEQVREAAELARSEDPFQVPPGFCPKCISVRRDASPACAACGLIYANFVPAEHRPSEPLRAAWLGVLSRWDDWDTHDRLLSVAMGRGELAQAGRLYRIRLAQAPEDLYAQRGRDEVVRLGLASASAATLVRPNAAALGKKLQLLAALIFIALLAGGGFFVFQQMRSTLVP
ncbi:hypothetical protein P2318_30790 [Myxococcaceae bacterium GXIMD 01537]